MRTIGLCLIIKNEKHNLEKLLSSVKNQVDWVYLTDTGSTDGSIQEAKRVCERLGLKLDVSEFTWVNNFSKARNFNFKQAKTDWVLWMDGDDTLEGEGLRDTIKKAEEVGATGVYMTYKYFTDKAGNEVNNHPKLRVVKNGYYSWTHETAGEVPLHENLFALPGMKTKEVGTQDQAVKHWMTESDMEDSQKRNIMILRELEKSEGNNPDPRTVFLIGRELNSHGDRAEAVEYLKRFLDMNGLDSESLHACSMISKYYETQGKFKEQLTWAYRGISYHPKHPLGYLNAGEAYRNMGRWEECADLCKQALEKKIGPAENLAFTEFAMDKMASIELANAYNEMGEHELAIKLIKKLGAYLEPEELEKAEMSKQQVMQDSNITRAKKAINMLANSAIHENDTKRLARVAEVAPNYIMHTKPVLDIKRSLGLNKLWPKGSIVIYATVGLEEWDEDSLKKGIGGSETAVIEMAKRFGKAGYHVTVYGDVSDKRVFDNVTYIPAPEVEWADEFDIFISWRNVGLFKKIDIKANKKFLWLHDVPVSNEFYRSVYDKIDKIIVLSDYHRNLLPDVPDEKFYISRNGIDTDLMDSLRDKVKRKPKKVIYASQPIRGLEFLLDSWAVVKESDKSSELVWAYGWDNYDIMIERGVGDQEFKDRMNKKMHELGVKQLGRLSKEELYKEFLSSDIWAYPTEFPEINCFPSGTRVLTDEGDVEIQNLRIDNSVYTHRNRLRPLVNIQRRYTKEPLYHFKIQNGDDLSVTGEHPLLVLSKNKNENRSFPSLIKESEVVWKKASEIKPNDIVLRARPIFSTDVPLLNMEYSVELNNLNTTQKVIPDVLSIGGDFAKWLGYFLGDGNASRVTGKVSILIADKHPEHKKYKEYFKVFGLEIKERQLQGCKEYYVHSHPLARTLYNNFYKNKKKTLPHRYISETNYGLILEGLMDSDGNYKQREGYDYIQATFTNTSLSLIGFVRSCAAKNGISAKTTKRVHDNGNISYTVSWGINNEMFFFGKCDKYLYLRIKTIDIEQFEGNVYNIEVEGDNTYIANGYVVHNCIVASEAQYAGCYPISTGLAALQETQVVGDKVALEDFAKTLIERLDRHDLVDYKKIKQHVSWNTIANEWMNDLFYGVEWEDDMPLVSVIHITGRHGGMRMLRDALAKQTYQNIELVIIDKLFSERADEVADYMSKLKVRHIHLPDSSRDRDIFRYGLCHAHNSALFASNGELLIFLQDFFDIPEDGIERFVELYKRYPDKLLAGVDRQYSVLNEVDKTDKLDIFKGKAIEWGKKQWESMWMKLGKGRRVSAYAREWEANWGAAPRKVLEKLGGWNIDWDKGFGWDNVEIAFRHCEMGGQIIVDEGNIAKGIRHENDWQTDMSHSNAQRFLSYAQAIQNTANPNLIMKFKEPKYNNSIRKKIYNFKKNI